jgi:hypothetical protein
VTDATRLHFVNGTAADGFVVIRRRLRRLRAQERKTLRRLRDVRLVIPESVLRIVQDGLLNRTFSDALFPRLTLSHEVRPIPRRR